MAKKIYSEQELLAMTKLRLRDVCKEHGVEFENSKTIEDLVRLILAKQSGNGQNDGDDDDDDDDDDKTTGSVRVTCGASSEVFPVAGKSIAYVRREYSVLLTIGRDAKAILNGTEQNNENHVLEENDNLEFVRKSGDKAR